MMLAPWVLLPTILALQGDFWPLGARAGRPSRGWRWLMGAVRRHRDALAGCLPAVIWWAWLPAESVVVALHRVVAWRWPMWWVMALTQLQVDPPFLDFIRIFRRDHAMVLAGGGAARGFRQLDRSWRRTRRRAPLVADRRPSTGTCLGRGGQRAGRTDWPGDAASW